MVYSHHDANRPVYLLMIYDKRAQGGFEKRSVRGLTALLKPSLRSRSRSGSFMPANVRPASDVQYLNPGFARTARTEKRARGRFMTRRRRIVLGVVFVLGMMICGLVAGAFIGGRFLLPPGSGLAGAAIVLGYGILGAGLAGVVGGLLAWLLPPKWFLGAALPVTVAGVVFGIIIVNGYMRSRAEMQAHLEQAYEDLLKFRVTLVYLDAENAPFMRMDADWGARRYTATTNGAEPTTCTAELSGEEAVVLLEALRGVEGVVLRDEFPCAGTLGEAERELDWFIPEALPPNSEGKHFITAACAAAYPALVRPFEDAAEIFRRGDHAKECG